MQLQKNDRWWPIVLDKTEVIFIEEFKQLISVQKCE